MADFKQALIAFFTGEIDLERLERTLVAELVAAPDLAAQRFTEIDKLHRTGRLSAPVYQRLCEQIETATGFRGQPGATGPAATSPPSTPSADATVVKGLPPDPPPSPPSADHTVIASTPRAPTGSANPTRPPTTPPTGTTGGTGFPTGTGESGWERAAGKLAAKDTGGIVGIGSTVKERYVLEKILGGGGMGTVYQARDKLYEEAEDRNPYVALKVINEEFKRHPKSLVALHREARKSQKLAHDNVVTVYDFDRDDATVYLTMELLRGKPLNEVISDYKMTGMPRERALPIIRDMSKALAYAHNKDIIHCDFKPGNVFFTDEGVVKVLDFGIARAAPKDDDDEIDEGDATRFDVGKEIGGYTPAYASLEMLQGGEPKAGDDVYALGCTAYELLSGRHPYGRLPARKALETDVVAKQIPGLKRREWRAIKRAVALRGEERTASVDEFLDELFPRQGAGSSFVVVAGLAAGVLALVGVGGSLVYSNFQARRVERLQEALLSGEPARVEAAITDLGQLSSEQQLRVFSNGNIQLSVQEFYLTRVGEVTDVGAGNYAFDDAQALLASYRSLAYSSALGAREIEDLIQQRLSEAEIVLAQRYREALAQGLLLPVDGVDDITDVIAQRRALDEAFVPGEDQELIDAYLAQAREILDGASEVDYGLAMRYVDVALSYAPDDSSLVNAQGEIRNGLAEQQRQARLAQVQSQLTNTPLDSLAAVDRAQPLVDELRRLEPQSPTLASVEQQVRALLTSEVAAGVDAREWARTRDVLSAYAALAGERFVEGQREQIAVAEREFDARLASLMGQIDDSAASGSFEQAQGFLSQLSEAGAGEPRIQQGRDLIASALLERSRAARQDSEWQQARAFVEQAKAVAPSPRLSSILDSERTFIDADERGQLEEATAEAEAQRLAAVNRVVSDFESLLAAPEFDLDTARQAKALLDDQLASLDPAHPLLSAGGKRLGDRLADDARQLGATSQWQAALDLSAQALALLPQSNSLRDIQPDLEAGLARQLELERAQDIERRKRGVEELLAQERFEDSDWLARLRGEIEDVGALSGDEAWARRINGAAGDGLLQAASRARLAGNVAEGTRLLQGAESFGTSASQVAQEREALASTQARLEAEREQQRVAAELQKRKRSVVNYARVGQFSNARAELERLQAELAGNDPFLVDEVPDAFAFGYRTLATSAARDEDYSRALRFVEAGLEYRPRDEDLLAARDRYEQALRAALEQPEPPPPEPEPEPEPVGPDPDELVADLLVVLGSRDPLPTAQVRSQLSELRSVASTPAAYRSAEDRLVAQALKTLGAMGSGNAATARKDALVALFPGDTRIAAYAVTPPPPAAPRDPCDRRLAGYGKRPRGRCQDTLEAGGKGPVLVVVPDGAVPGFAITRYEISIAEYQRYCGTSAACSAPSGADDMPVTGITVADAKAYAVWLSDESGYRYRLPTKEEWQHAAAAGGKPGSNFNCRLRVGGNLIRGTALEPQRSPSDQNDWGLQHHVGNAQEWVVVGAGVQAAGGAFSNELSECNVTIAVGHGGNADRSTGFRLLRELGPAR